MFREWNWDKERWEPVPVWVWLPALLVVYWPLVLLSVVILGVLW